MKTEKHNREQHFCSELEHCDPGLQSHNLHSYTITTHTATQSQPTQLYNHNLQSYTITTRTTTQSQPTQLHNHNPHNYTITTHTATQSQPTQLHNHNPHSYTIITYTIITYTPRLHNYSSLANVYHSDIFNEIAMKILFENLLCVCRFYFQMAFY